MIPSSGSLFAQPLTVGTLPTRTFRMRFDSGTIAGTVDEREAVRQAIYLIFGTERYRYAIYGWDYGITGVDGFEFTVKGKAIACTCTARTVYGDVEAELEAVI